MPIHRKRCTASYGIMTALFFATPALAAPPAGDLTQALAPMLTYSDLVDLAEAAPQIVRAKVRKQAEIEPARAAGLRAGWARLYIEAVTENLLTGPAAVGGTLHYLADLPRDSRGRAPKLTKQSVLLFARGVPGRPGELQLVAPDAQIMWDALTEAQLRSVLGELFAPGAPGRITGVAEAIHVPGTLAGEGETQLFLATPDGAPATITVLHHPGIPAHWSVSFSEVVDSTGLPPPRNTLAWYRLACSLPPVLSPSVNVSSTFEDKASAEADYQLVLAGLGACGRTR
ncbi:MAG: hypothetical protein ABIQ66_01150 [Novosphingobium sp.]